MSTTITPTEQNIEINVNNDVIDINVTNEIVDVNATTQQIDINVAGAYPIPNPVLSVFGRTGVVVATDGDYTLTQLGDVTLSSPSNGQVLKYNGTAWVNSTDADTGITTLNTLTALSQTFATGTSGTDFNISSATATHTFNLPTASATNRGALSSADWTTFNSKQNALTNPITGTGTSGQIAYFNGTSSLTSSATFAFTPTSQLLVNNSVTAASAIARGTNLTPTLTAAANNDVLVGLDINPTFTNGAFTGIKNIGLRVGGASGLNYDVANQRLGIGTNAPVVDLDITKNVGAGGGVVGQFKNSNALGEAAITIRNDNYYAAFEIFGSGFGSGLSNTALFTTQNGVTELGFATLGNAKIAFRTNSNGSSNERISIFGSTGNVAINQTTDAGFRLDVNGTARVQGVITGSVGSGSLTLGTATGNTVAISLSGFFTGNGAIEVSNGNPRGFINRINAQGEGGYFIQSNTANFQSVAHQINYFRAGNALTISNPVAGSEVNGFYFNPSVTNQGVSSIFAFRSDLSAATNRWNLYMAGTASNYLEGDVAIGTTTLGTATKLTVGGSETASSAIARGGLINTTLVAAANNDVLVGLDINPTFTNGAFTGVSNFGLRVLSTGSTQLQIGNTGTNQFFNIGRNGSNGYLTFDGAANGNGYIFSKSATNYAIIDGTGINIGTGASPFAAISTTLKIAYQGLNSVFAANPATDSYIVLRNTNDGKKIAFGHDGTGAMNFYSEATNVSFTSANIVGKYFATGNWAIGSNPSDAGFKLDVNGTARVQDNLTIADTKQLSWGNGNFIQATNSIPDIKFFVQSSLVLTLGNTLITAALALRTRDIYSNSDNTFDIGQQFTRYRNGWFSGQFKIGDATAVNASAKLQIDSTTQGFLPPRMTSAQRTAIASPATGLIVYQTDGVEGLWLRASTGWVQLTVV